MLKSRDMVKGMIIEFTNSIGKIQLGDQYELIKAPYKGGSSALSIELLKVGSPEGTKPIKIFWVYVNGIMKVISTPQVENEAFSANELKASSNEEYLFVSNTNDKLYYRDLKQYHTPKSDDVIIGNLVFTKKSGQRKRIKNIQSYNGNFDDLLPSIIHQLPSIDLAYIDGNHRFDPTINYFHQLLNKTHNNSILVFDDIHWSEEMEQAWDHIRQNSAVTCSIDLFFIGIILLSNNFKVKQDFVIRF